MPKYKCQRNPLCFDQKCRDRNQAYCNCESWFPTDELAAEACKQSATAAIRKSGDKFAFSKSEYLENYAGGQRQFIEDFGHDPIAGDSVRLQDTTRYQTIAAENAAKAQTRRYILIGSIAMAAIGLYGIYVLFIK